VKLVVAVIAPEFLDDVKACLGRDSRISSVTQVLGGRYQVGSYRGRNFRIPLADLRLEIIVTDWLAETVVDAIAEAACLSVPGEECLDKVFVVPLDHHGSFDFQDEEIWSEEPVPARARR
jgi:nitrogen regulatory protein PII